MYYLIRINRQSFATTFVRNRDSKLISFDTHREAYGLTTHWNNVDGNEYHYGIIHSNKIPKVFK